MDVHRIKEEIEHLEVEASKHEKEAEGYRQEEQRINGSLEQYSEREVREAQLMASKHEQKVASIRNRIASLQSRLPAKAEVKKARKQFQELLAKKEDAEKKLLAMWPEFVSSLEAAEQIGHQIREVRAVNQESQAQLQDLKREYGLDTPIPVIGNSDNNLAWLLCQWLSDAASGGHNTVIDRDLAAARQKEKATEPIDIFGLRS